MSDSDAGIDSALDSADISRRQWVQLLTGGAGVLLAGCGGGDTGDTGDGGATPTPDEGTPTGTTTTGDGAASGEYVDTPMRIHSANRIPLSDYELNPHSQNTAPALRMTNGFLSQWWVLGGEWINVDIANHELDIENNQLRITLKDDVYWHNKDEGVMETVTGADLVQQAELSRLMVPKDAREENPLEVGYEADGKTFIVNLADEFNDQIAKRGWLEATQITPAAYRNGVFADKLEALKDASSGDEATNVRKEVTQISMSFDNGVMCGPWILDQATSANLAVFRLNKDHWVTERFNWDEFRILVPGGGSEQYPALAQDKLDILKGAPPENVNYTRNAMAVSYPQERLDGMFINYRGDLVHPLLSRENLETSALIRQAFAYAIDNKSFVDTTRPIKGSYRGRVTGMGSGFAKRLYGGDYSMYPKYETNQEKAAKRMQSAGFSKSDGTWMTPDGEPFKIRFSSRPFARLQAVNLVDQLRDFGVNVEHITKGNSKFISDYWGKKKYSIVKAKWGDSVPPGFFALTAVLQPGGQDTGSTVQPPKEFPVPPMGELTGDPTETVNVEQLIPKFEKNPTDDLIEEMKRLSWVFAYHLPAIPLGKKKWFIQVNRLHFNWPDPVPESNKVRVTATKDDSPIFGMSQQQGPIMHGAVELLAKES